MLTKILENDLKLTFEQIYFLNRCHIFKTEKNIGVSRPSPQKRSLFGGKFFGLEPKDFGYVSSRKCF